MKATKKVKVPRTVVGVKHGKVVGARLTKEDRAVLDQAAKEEGVGICTLCRLILEQYITQHYSKQRRSKKRKR